MKQDSIWQAFARTGDPLYYLLYRAIERREGPEMSREQANSQTTAVRN